MATYIYFEVKRRVPPTHNLKVRCSYIKWSSRYKAKSLDHEIWVTTTYIYFGVKRWVTRTHNPKVRYSYIKWSSRYKAKSLDHEISVTTTYIYFRSNVGSYGLIIPKNDVHTSNGLQDMRQNHWTMKYGSRRPTFILGQTSDHTDS